MDRNKLFPVGRMEAYSDAVIAIIITLIVIEIKIPHFEYSPTNADYIKELLHIAPHYIAFVLSFLILSIIWNNHHHFFRTFHLIDTKMLWINNYLLFTLAMLPFSTGFLGTHPLDMIPVLVYGINLTLMSSAWYLLGKYTYKYHPEAKSMTEYQRKTGIKNTSLGLYLYSVATLCVFVHPAVSLLGFILIPIYYFVPKKHGE